MADIISYLVSILIIVGIYTILALSLNLVLGYTGLLNLGHIALFAIGAYTSVLLHINGVPFYAAFLSAGVVASFFGFLLIYGTKKISGDYYALATLGFAFVVHSLLLNLNGLTRGPLGIAGIPRPNIFGFFVRDNVQYLFLVVVIAFITYFLLNKIVTSKFGKLLEAMRDDELGVGVLGKNTAHLKYKAMAISAFFAGIAGSLFAHYISFIDPSSFYINELILVLTIVIIGGIASLKGTVIATLIVIAIPEALRFLPLPSGIIGPARQIIYALILLIIVMYRPRGILGRIDLE